MYPRRSVKEDTVLTATGNVITAQGGNQGDQADDQGADAPVTVTGVVAGSAASASGNVGTTISGTYGTLTLNADGSYTYALDNDSAAVQALVDGQIVDDVFTYTITDADGDTSTTTLTIKVEGQTDQANIINDPDPDGSNGADAGKVYERGLTSIPDTSEFTSGELTVTATDGIASVTIGGQTYTLADWANKTISTPIGTLTITTVTTNLDATSSVLAYT